MSKTLSGDAGGKCNLAELIERIEQSHHRFTRDQLQRIELLMHRLEPPKQVEAGELQACFDALNADLVQHLLKEERVLFPYIIKLEADPGVPPVSCFGSLANPIRMMQFEHATVRVLQAKIRQMASDHAAHPQREAILTEIYTALAELDEDLVQHMNLEDDILFPRAIALEMQTVSPHGSPNGDLGIS